MLPLFLQCAGLRGLRAGRSSSCGGLGCCCEEGMLGFLPVGRLIMTMAGHLHHSFSMFWRPEPKRAPCSDKGGTALHGRADKPAAWQLGRAAAVPALAGGSLRLTGSHDNPRRKLLLCSLAGVVIALAALAGAFQLSEAHSPPVLAAGPLKGSCPVAGPQTCAQCLAQVRAHA